MRAEALLRNEETAVFRLRGLYEGMGYTPYKMSKFEEYDLYARNKHFLVSENIITFTDTNGKLMALKPDVTLSIIKNGRDVAGAVQKLYYNENVYRVSKGTRTFKELMQVGLECVGDVDDYCICEVLCLAADSLAEISPEYALDISDLTLLGSVLDSLGVSDEGKKEMLHCIGEKNVHGVKEIATAEGVEEAKLSKLLALLELSSEPAVALVTLRELLPECGAEIDRLAGILKALDTKERKGKISLDFSVVNDMSYYNGIVFKGFINGVPAGVLSGGQYDGLMKKMGRGARAIGFAVYLDLLERLEEGREAFDADAVLLYSGNEEPAEVQRAAASLAAEGKRISVMRTLPEKFRCKELYQLLEGKVTLLETYA